MKRILALTLVLALGLAGSALATPVNGVIGFALVPSGATDSAGMPLPAGAGTDPATPLHPSDIFYVDIVMYRAVPGTYLGISSTGGLYLNLSPDGAFTYTPGRYSDQNATDTNPTLDSVGVTYYQNLGQALPPSSPTTTGQGFQYIPQSGFTPAYTGLNVMDVLDPQNLAIAGQLPANAYDILVNGMGPTVVMFDHIAIHCEGPLDVQVTLDVEQTASIYGVPTIISSETGFAIGEDFGALGDQLTIYQVPEPMTMALLGLGGLALIRRRRA